ncbi:THAP domain-containing protein 6-like [Stegodyphus dumicola]|uniref:THAP domain-containing protein 6-like n=1 Tax=Stegodyphus dumicola TaxID=202533 RepID=UPI0015B1EEC1|nr:THAP domain-containing protein 6-like [Stegodyphus dumicola]
MVTCCVPLCGSRSDRKKNIDAIGKKITFHEFPSNKEKRKKWTRAILRRGNKPNELWTPVGSADRSVICSLHFHPADFKQGLKLRRLQPYAVPSIFNERNILKSQKASHNGKCKSFIVYNGIADGKVSFPTASKENVTNNFSTSATVVCKRKKIMKNKHVGTNTTHTNTRLKEMQRKYRILLEEYKLLEKSLVDFQIKIKDLENENMNLQSKLSQPIIIKLQKNRDFPLV